jgi:hypothetical protein
MRGSQQPLDSKLSGATDRVSQSLEALVKHLIKSKRLVISFGKDQRISSTRINVRPVLQKGLMNTREGPASDRAKLSYKEVGNEYRRRGQGAAISSQILVSLDKPALIRSGSQTVWRSRTRVWHYGCTKH